MRVSAPMVAILLVLLLAVGLLVLGIVATVDVLWPAPVPCWMPEDMP